MDIILFSGGMDSTVLAGSLMQQGCDLSALMMSKSPECAETLSAKQIAIKLDLNLEIFDASSLQKMAELMGNEFAVGGQLGGCTISGATYAPYSVEVMHTIAEMYALGRRAKKIYWAIHADDVQDVESMTHYLWHRSSMINLRTGFELKYETPLLHMTKRQVLEMGYNLGLPMEETRSCSVKDGLPCGACVQCVLRSDAFIHSIEAVS